MAFNDFSAESPQNYAQKTICCFVVDVSGSMKDGPINQLNHGLEDFYKDIKADHDLAERLEVAIVEFSDTVTTRLLPSLAESFTMPVLTAGGTTKLVDGVREAINLVEARKAWYKQTGQKHLRPWIILITDGAPDEDQDVNGLASEIENGTQNSHFAFLSIGVQNADMNFLNSLPSYVQDQNRNWVKRPPESLQGLKFHEFFKWLSESMGMVAVAKAGDKINLPNNSSWAGGLIIE